MLQELSKSEVIYQQWKKSVSFSLLDPKDSKKVSSSFLKKLDQGLVTKPLTAPHLSASWKDSAEVARMRCHV